ncbi:MAG: mercuric transport protein MerTP [Flavobacteriales bacterium]|nr:mercuric transport protein MerTP [Flavobacteriales bacterium]
MKNDRKLIWTSVFTAVGASLCCIAPVLALISGATGMASAFSWMEPLRPYLIGITILVLGFAWYQHLKTKQEVDCNCEPEKASFMQSRKFLVLITLFAGLMTAFPYYSTVFYSDNSQDVDNVSKENVIQVAYQVEGMTCTSCEEHVIHAVNELKGIIDVTASYEKGNAIVSFDRTRSSNEQIAEAIGTTGYKIIETKEN